MTGRRYLIYIKEITMPRAKIFGYIACIAALAAGAVFFYNAFISVLISDALPAYPGDSAYLSVAVPIGIIALSVLGTGCWIGWTILTIKVVPPMPEIMDKKDHSKIKAFILCLVSLALSCLFIYGVVIRSYWALAVPAGTATLVILGMIFWVGLAIITTRSTLPDDKK